MSRCSRTATLAALSILWCGASASADTLRCQSVNGNLNCAGSGGVSCQTVDGKKVCVSGHGDVVQSFGNGKSSGDDVNAVQASPGGQGLVDSDEAGRRPHALHEDERLIRFDNFAHSRNGSRQYTRHDQQRNGEDGHG